MWKLDMTVLAKVFFWFGIICAILAFFTQWGLIDQVSDLQLFADPVFYLLLGMWSMLAGILVNTDKTNRMV